MGFLEIAITLITEEVLSVSDGEVNELHWHQKHTFIHGNTLQQLLQCNLEDSQMQYQEALAKSGLGRLGLE